MLDLRISHDRVGSSTDPTLNGHLRYPINLDQSLNDEVVDKVRNYRADYNNTQRVWYHLCLLLLVRLGGYMVNLSDFYSYRFIGKLTAFFQIQEFSLRNLPVEDSSTFTVTVFSNLKSKNGNLLAKTEVLRINLNLDQCMRVA